MKDDKPANQNTVKLAEVLPLAKAALMRAGCDAENATAVAESLWKAERDGAHSHGLFRLPGYLTSLKSGKVNGKARPLTKAIAPGVLHIDGDGGYGRHG